MSAARARLLSALGIAVDDKEDGPDDLDVRVYDELLIAYCRLEFGEWASAREAVVRAMRLLGKAEPNLMAQHARLHSAAHAEALDALRKAQRVAHELGLLPPGRIEKPNGLPRATVARRKKAKPVAAKRKKTTTATKRRKAA